MGVIGGWLVANDERKESEKGAPTKGVIGWTASHSLGL